MEILGIKRTFSRKRPERKWKNFTKRCILARRIYSISFIPLSNFLGCLKSISNFWKNLFGRFGGGRRLKSKKLYQTFFVRLAILFRYGYLRFSNFSKMAALEPKNWKFWWGGLPPSERLWRWSRRPPNGGWVRKIHYLRIFWDQVQVSSSIRRAAISVSKNFLVFEKKYRKNQNFKKRSRPILDLIEDYLLWKFQPPSSKTVASRTQKPKVLSIHIVHNTLSRRWLTTTLRFQI